MGIFQQAVRKRKKLRMAIEGPSGSGKTMTALLMASRLGKKIFVIDTEFGSASLYAGEVVNGVKLEFQKVDLTTFSPTNYIMVMDAAVAEGADVIIIDSLSHAWAGTFGVLDIVNQAGGKFQDWAKGTKEQNELVNHILALPCHVIATMRSRTEYVMEDNEKGRKTVTKVGTKAVQREGMDYEFDVVMMMDRNHNGEINKTRCRTLSPYYAKPGVDLAETLLQWLNSGSGEDVPCDSLSTRSPESPQTQEPVPTPDPRPVYEPPGVSDTKDPEETETQLKAAIRDQIKDAGITRKMYEDWRKDHRLFDDQQMSLYHMQALLGDIKVYKERGTWLELPFDGSLEGGKGSKHEVFSDTET